MKAHKWKLIVKNMQLTIQGKVEGTTLKDRAQDDQTINYNSHSTILKYLIPNNSQIIIGQLQP